MKRVLGLLIVSLVCISASGAWADDRPALGVTMSDNAGDTTAGGVTITLVAVDSPAAKAGLLAGDQIVAINDKPVASSADVIRAVGASAANSPLKLDVTRGIWRATITATLGKADDVFRVPPAMQPLRTTGRAYYNNQGYGRRQYRGVADWFFNRPDPGTTYIEPPPTPPTPDIPSPPIIVP